MTRNGTERFTLFSRPTRHKKFFFKNNIHMIQNGRFCCFYWTKYSVTFTFRRKLKKCISVSSEDCVQTRTQRRLMGIIPARHNQGRIFNTWTDVMLFLELLLLFSTTRATKLSSDFDIKAARAKILQYWTFFNKIYSSANPPFCFVKEGVKRQEFQSFCKKTVNFFCVNISQNKLHVPENFQGRVQSVF